MSTYPGDDPQTPEDSDETEPTQPVGYWERRANEQAAEQARAQGGQPYPTTPYTQHAPVFNPTSAYPTTPPSQPAPPPAPGYGPGPQGPGQSAPNPYSQKPFGQGPYGSPGQASYGGQSYGGQPPGQPPATGQPAPYMPMPSYGGFVAPPPDHPQATLSLVLGLVGVIGFFIFCGVTVLVSPFAWAFGHSAVKEIRASQGRLGGESQAWTGMVLGIVGTVLLILALIFLIGVIVLIAVSESTTTTGSSV